MSQSFLADPAIADAAVQAAGLHGDETVVEPGPGLGLLTERLVARAARVIAVELDRELAASLRRYLVGPNLEVIQQDVLRFEPEAHGLLDYVLVSNLPYQVSTAVLTRFMVQVRPPRRMVLMLQREVAERLLAIPGEMSFLAVQTQLLTEPRLVRRVPSGAFVPRPNVDSALVRFDLRPSPAAGVADVPGFLALVRAGFTQPRKQLRNSLAQGLGREPSWVGALLEQAALDGVRRAQELTIEEWARLHPIYTAAMDGER